MSLWKLVRLPSFLDSLYFIDRFRKTSCTPGLVVPIPPTLLTPFFFPAPCLLYHRYDFGKRSASYWQLNFTSITEGVNLFSPTIWVSDSTFHWKVLPQDRLTDLKDLIQSEDGQSVSQDSRNLIFRAIFEIESWLIRGEGAMTFETQITLSNMAYNGPTKNNICDQFSYKV